MNHKYLIIIIVSLSLLLGVFIAEYLLRINNLYPYQYIKHQNVPVMHEFDKKLGWHSKEGQYSYPPYDSGKIKIKVKILKPGLRITHPLQTHLSGFQPKIIFVGGSYTFGLGLSDSETFPWKVQQNFQSFDVLNYGCSGYGTFQSLLRLEQILAEIQKVKYILYGYIEHHEIRNVGLDRWKAILATSAKDGIIYLPYADIDNSNEIIRHPPERFEHFLPLADKSAVIRLIERVILKMRSYESMAIKRKLTKRLIQKMDILSKKNNAEFIVLILQAKKAAKTDYIDFFNQNNITYIDVAFPLTNEFRIKNEGHPNGIMNSIWANDIVNFLKDKEGINRSGENE